LRYRLLEAFRTQFRFKVFLVYAVCSTFISCVFTVFLISHQRQRLKADIIDDGRLLADTLAHNARIGVFSGNKKMLGESIAGILQRPEVVAASLYAPDGTRLAERIKPLHRSGTLSSAAAASPLPSPKSLPCFQELDGMLEFWAPVTAGTTFSAMDDLYGDFTSATGSASVIGAARLLVDTGPLRDQLRLLLYKSISIGVLCLLSGLGIVYLLARVVTNPLGRLTRVVESLGSRGFIEQVPVESDDEIGNLARALKSMAESLRSRERQLQESHTRLRQLSARVLNAQEEERRRLARELHDDLGQALALLKIRLCSLEKKISDDQIELKKDCRETESYLEQIIDDIRRLSKDLSPAVLEDLGLTEGLRVLCRDFSRHHHIELTCSLFNIDSFLHPDTQINLYRFCQEALTNIQKHAHADKISVVIECQNNYITVHIKDNGIGFDMTRVSPPDQTQRGMGLTTLEERACMMKGGFTIQSTPGEGTCVTLQFPAEAAS